MYDQNTTDQCLKLLAEGKSYRRVAEELNISAATVNRWSLDHHAATQQMRAARLEALHEQYVGNYEDKLSDMANEVAAINAELKLRDFGDVSTEFLLYRKTCLQARLEKLAARETPAVESQPPAVESDPQPQAAEQKCTL